MDTWLLTCTGSQLAPLSVLEKISRGVMVNNVLGGPTDGQVMDVRVGDPAGDDLPRIAAVLAVPHTVHFDAGPNVLVVYRVHQQGGHPGDAHIGALLGQCHRQLVPMPATVLGTEQR